MASPTLMGAGPSDLQVGHIRYPGEWNPRPTALRRLLWEVGQRTSIEVELSPSPIELGDPGLFRHPLLYLTGAERLPSFEPEEIRALRRHLTYGGILVIDAADAQPGGPFDQSVRRLLEQLFPRRPLTRLPDDHVVYKSFYLVPYQGGRVIRRPFLEGVLLDERYAVLYSQNDLGGAWARDAFGRWEYDVNPGGETQRELTFRLGVNIAMYALCLDYKDDLVHTPFILRRRR
ncbi:MAG: DUF4159 domain-containing protein [Myxococcota bacterium]